MPMPKQSERPNIPGWIAVVGGLTAVGAFPIAYPLAKVLAYYYRKKHEHPELFTPEIAEQLTKKYLHTMKLDGFSFSKDSFESCYKASRTKDAEQRFTALKEVDDAPFELQNIIESNDQLSKLIENCFTTKDLDIAGTTFKNTTAQLEKDFILNPYKAITQDFPKAADEMLKAIKAQHEKEPGNLEALKVNDEFKKQFGDKSDKVHAAMVKQVKAEHDQALKKFEDDMIQSKINLFESLAADEARISILAIYRGRIKTTEDYRNKLKGTTATISQGADPDFIDLELSEIESIESASGKTLKLNKDGGVELDIGSILFNPSYFFVGKQLEQDIAALVAIAHAQGLKQGATGIKLTVTCSNPDLAAERARLMYAEAVKHYPPEKVKIYVNGTLYYGSQKSAPDKPAEHVDNLFQGKFKPDKLEMDRIGKEQLSKSTLHAAKQAQLSTAQSSPAPSPTPARPSPAPG